MTVPVRPDAITAEVFRALTGRADVTGVRLVGEDHGTAVRARLQVTGSPDEPGTVFAKLTPTRPVERLFNNLMGLGHNEVEVYRRLGDELRGVTPDVYGAASDRGRSIVLMEDLALRDARFGDVAGSCTPDEAVAVARALAGFHARFWESGRFTTDLACFTPPAARSVSRGPQTWRLVALLPRRYHDVVPRGVRDDSRILRTRRHAVAAALRDFPLTFLHGDTHRGNICFVGDRPILFDWQVAAQGPGLKDLAYFAVTSLDPDVRRAVERDLLITYLDALHASAGPRLSFARAWDDFRMLAVTGYTAAAVTAAFSGRLQGEEVTRAGLNRAAQAVQDLDSFAELRRRL
ncbi:phosphotransferase [Mycolicibacterium sp. CR10]|uniref:phosphotransferase n=1 Tax=Mycolicibacterium sp. CR10 TaxID=2562314 RepID=UPI0010C02507|nr:phosphotransferase [Mycolicibacterium sp. CR10]